MDAAKKGITGRNCQLLLLSLWEMSPL